MIKKELSFSGKKMLMPVKIRIRIINAFNRCHSLTHKEYKYILTTL